MAVCFREPKVMNSSRAIRPSATSRRRPPNSFVWIPASLAMGIAGSAMTVGYALGGGDAVWLHTLGTRLLLQGMFVGLVLGVGGLAIPLMTRGQAPPDGESTAADSRARAGHALAAVALVASFVVETQFSPAAGMSLRALVVLVVLLLGPEIWRRPTEAGWNRRFVWVSSWMIPVGYALAAAFPLSYKAGLHVVFIGGFASLALAVGTQVVLGHRGHREQMLGRPWQVPTIATFLLAAGVARALVDFDRTHFFAWLAVASVFFLLATLVWAAFLIPKIVSPVDPSG